MEAIVEALFKGRPNVSDEQKVIGFYHWYRRLVYPYRYMASDRRDVLKALNTAGFSLCGSQAAVTTAILRAGGYTARPVQANAGKEWGHTVWEVKYDGRWHLYDAMTAFYVMTRDNPPHVASVEEIEADPTLVTKAVEEKRCGPEYCYTARDHEITLDQREQFQQETRGQDVPWSLLTTRTGSMLDFWTAAATKRKLSSGSETDAYGAGNTPGVLDIRLKANERYVRMWTGVGKWMTAPSFVRYCPQNMAAGDNERFDTVNFRYFEPYRQERPNPFNKAIYRSYGNGYLEWTPASSAQFAQGQVRPDGLKELTNTDRNRGFVMFSVDGAAKAASLTIPVKSPYAVVEIELELSLALPKDAVASLSLAPLVKGKPGGARPLWSSKNAPTSAPDAPTVSTAGDLATIVVPLVHTPDPIYEYELKLTFANAAGGTIGFKRMKTTFQLNPMALPGLVPGVNKVRVTAAAPVKIVGGRLQVTYSWHQPPDWTKGMTDTHDIVELPFAYELKVPDGDKLPRMRYLEMFLRPD
jgi:hypothetical protein